MNITKYEITGPSWDGGILNMMVAGSSPEDAISQCSRSEEMKWTGKTEELPYLHFPMMAAVAASLPGEWSAVPNSKEYADCNFYLVRADGLTIFAGAPSYSHKDKWQFSYSSPSDSKLKRVDVGSASIGCGIGKSAEKMAADIAKRLLPDCERLQVLANDKMAIDNAADEKRNASLFAVCDALGSEPRRSGGNGDYRLEGWGAADGPEYRINWGGSVDLKLNSLSTEKAVAIIKLIRSLA